MTRMTPAAPFRAWATIDLQALRHNFAVARRCNPACSMVVVVKANAYGHGVLPVASVLEPEMRDVDVFGVASLEEALELQGQSRHGILLLEGVLNEEELALAVDRGFHLVIHSLYQLDMLEARLQGAEPPEPLTIWLKLDSGMHRLGLGVEDFAAAWQRLRQLQGVGKLVLMTHLACADDLVAPATQRQVTHLQRALRTIDVVPGEQCPVSVAASAGILAWPQTHFQWLRPGIMLYGGSAILGEDGIERDLKPVMSLRSRVIAIKQVEAGSSIGYGATYVCPGPGRIAIVSIGYGDGYPRHAPTGTPVLLRSGASIIGGAHRTRLIGRVSMDMIAIDVSEIREAAVGDEVILWGEGLPADQIARQCGTISYELFCKVTSRVHFVYQ